MHEQPAVIDISGLVEGSVAALDSVAGELTEPCASWGAFHIVGHGVPLAELERFEAAMRAFFDLPTETKHALRRSADNARGWYDTELTKNRPDWKEVFDYGAERPPDARDARHSDGRNQWPPDEESRKTLLAHYHSCERVGLALLRALCVSLDVDSETLAPAFAAHTSFVRLNHYAPCPEPAPPDAPHFPERGHLGVHHHTDAGALTLVYQDAVPGLQIEHDGRFVTIQPVPGAFSVNLADMLQVWSNDTFRSPVHRVTTSADRARYSAPFFLNPDYDAVAQPLPGLTGPAVGARYRPVSWAHFRSQRSAGDYADEGHEIQIADYRIDPEH
jgi:isopenicillin N synthase-like dioxygenase